MVWWLMIVMLANVCSIPTIRMKQSIKISLAEHFEECGIDPFCFIDSDLFPLSGFPQPISRLMDSLQNKSTENSVCIMSTKSLNSQSYLKTFEENCNKETTSIVLIFNGKPAGRNSFRVATDESYFVMGTESYQVFAVINFQDETVLLHPALDYISSAKILSPEIGRPRLGSADASAAHFGGIGRAQKHRLSLLAAVREARRRAAATAGLGAAEGSGKDIALGGGGGEGVEGPVDCFVCVVLMATLVPLAVNLALQAGATLVCRLNHLTDDQCLDIRYVLEALGVALVPLEVAPVARICQVQTRCHPHTPPPAAQQEAVPSTAVATAVAAMAAMAATAP